MGDRSPGSVPSLAPIALLGLLVVLLTLSVVVPSSGAGATPMGISRALASVSCGGPSAGVRPCGGIPSVNGTYAWSPIPGAGPPARYRAAMTYDPADGYVVLFGGCGRICGLNDTWTYQNGVWRNLTGTTGPTPPGRWGAAMAYYPGISGRGYVVMFGGFGPGGFLGDTWGFSGGHWQPIVVPPGSSSPPPRAGASFATDNATGGVILFGGSTNFAGKAFLNDTWSFADGLWTQLSPTVSPASRAFAPMAYDPTLGSGAEVLFGGAISSGIAKDTWEFSSGAWTRLTELVGPTSREGAVMAYDPNASALVLFGGLGRLGYDGDTWFFESGKWLEENATSSPPATTGMAMAYDGSSGYLVAFGGWNLSTLYSVTWGFAPAGTPFSPTPPTRAGLIERAAGSREAGSRSAATLGAVVLPVLVGARASLPPGSRATGRRRAPRAPRPDRAHERGWSSPPR